MPPKRAPKRNAAAVNGSGLSTPRKRGRPSRRSDPEPQPHSPSSSSASPDPLSTPSQAAGGDPLRLPHPFAAEAEEYGIVQRKYYPHEMSTARARAYTNNQLPRPIEDLQAAQRDTFDTRSAIEVRDTVIFWFRTDLRTTDNTGLRMAGERARESNVPLIGMYIISPEDWEAHLAAPVRIDFLLRSLAVLRTDLAELGIPLYVEVVESRREIPARIAEFLEEWGASHLYANMEYEVDELRRDATITRMCAARRISVHVVHDTCVVPPGALQTGTGKQYAVYTPWYRSWVAHLHRNPDMIAPIEPPPANSSDARHRVAALFDCEVPTESPWESQHLSSPSDTDGAAFATKLRALWPAGEHAARERLDKFCDERIEGYARDRNFPAERGATSSISCHLAAGTLSARTCVRAARTRNRTKHLDGGVEGISTWISEIAWRDFYRHVLVHWPFVCMNKPFKPEYSDVEWSWNRAHFDAWCEGRTGFPLVDAAMRQMREMGWMHNRCRMVVSSFLAKDLLLDWRLGERWFMLNLVDGDFASNSGGWGFGASVGVDPQPYFRVFNPILQSERFDPDGEYIRRWVPELRGVKDRKKIHDPYGRGAGDAAKKGGYPKMIVEHKEVRDRALSAYKAGLEKNKT